MPLTTEELKGLGFEGAYYESSTGDFGIHVYNDDTALFSDIEGDMASLPKTLCDPDKLRLFIGLLEGNVDLKVADEPKFAGVLTDREAIYEELTSSKPPSPSCFSPFIDLVEELKALHIKKSTDYGEPGDPYANYRESEGLGIPAWKGVMVRMGDKWQRIKAYAERGVLVNEGIEDALKDMAVHSMIALILLREAKSNSPESDK
jgi:hypothetical protein